MPYASDAQRKYMHAAMDRGDIKPSVVKEYDEHSKGRDLPARKHPKPRVRRRAPKGA